MQVYLRRLYSSAGGFSSLQRRGPDLEAGQVQGLDVLGQGLGIHPASGRQVGIPSDPANDIELALSMLQTKETLVLVKTHCTVKLPVLIVAIQILPSLN